MMSNYGPFYEDENALKTVKCQACHGSGLVEVHGQETDCIECEGWGDIEVPV